MFKKSLVINGVIGLIIASIGGVSPAHADKGISLIVDTLADTVDGDVSSVAALNATPGADGSISLRESITAANNTSGENTINFTVSGSIALGSELPAISDVTGGTRIEGAGVIRLENASGLNTIDGLRITSAGNTITGMAIDGFAAGIRITGETATGNSVRACTLGQESVGAKGSGIQLYGIVIEGGASSNTIGGLDEADTNVLSGNDSGGILLTGGAYSNIITRNAIGTNKAGTIAIPNGGNGILLDDAHDNSIGGGDSVSGNLISGNADAGIRITNGSANNEIGGNIIGLSRDGTAVLPNSAGIILDGLATGNTIGVAVFDGDNVIAGNSGAGIQIANTMGNTIQNNYIGTNRTVTAGLGNGGSGIVLSGSAENNLLGRVFGYSNTIAYNGADGILLDGELVQSNPIRENRFLNNAGQHIHLRNGAQNALQPPVLNAIAPDTAPSGTTIPNGTVELYVKYSDGDYLFYDRVVSDSEGNFNYFEFHFTEPLTLVATVTDANQNTSGFSTPVPIPIVLDGDPFAIISVFLSSVDNGDGLLDFAEFEIATGRDNSSFDAIDVNGDRLVSPLELLDASIAEAGYDVLTVDTLADTLDAVAPITAASLMENPGPDGKVSLREALLASGTADDLKIEFVVAGTIAPTTELPPIIDSFNSTVIRGNGAIILDGANLTGLENGLTLLDANNTIEGLGIVNFPGSGIKISGNNASGNYILACNIGTDGTVAQGNGAAGISVEDGATSTNIGGGILSLRNVISGNHTGIVFDGSSFNTVFGNYIGVDSTGMSAIPNTVNGIATMNGAAFNSIFGAPIQGIPNIISGNGDGSGDGGISLSGVGNMFGTTNFTLIGGNYIGLNAEGAPLLGNNPHGIRGSNGVQGAIIGYFDELLAEEFDPAEVKGFAAFHKNRTKGENPGFMLEKYLRPNMIAGNVGDGIQFDGASVDMHLMIGNAIYSNGGDAIVLLNGANGGIEAPVIRAVNGSTISGTGIPGSLLQVFGDNEDEAQFPLARTQVDGAGNWSVALGKGGVFANFTAQNTLYTRNSSMLSAPVAADGSGSGSGGEGEGEGEGECEGMTTDSDGDGVSDCVEGLLGTNPNMADTDGDGMTDGFERRFGLDPLSAADALVDSDGDDLSNLEEFHQNSDPTDPQSPAIALYVDGELGIDMPGGGQRDNPLQTISFAMQEVEVSEGAVKRINVRGGQIYTGIISVPPGVVLSGPADGSATVIGGILAGEGSTVQDLTVMAGAENDVLVHMDRDRFRVRRVRFVGDSLDRSVTGILAGAGAATGLIDTCEFLDMGIGIDIDSGVPVIRKCIFQDPGIAGIYIRATALIGEDGHLSTSRDAASGFNTFSFGTKGLASGAEPMAVINETDVVLRMENNDWGTDSDGEVDALIQGPADFNPKLAKGSAILASTIICTLFDDNNQKRLVNASVTLTGSGFDPISDNEEGVYVFPAVPAGAYLALCETNGYVDATADASVGGSELKTVAVPMGVAPPPGGEGEGEGEDEKASDVPAFCGPGGFGFALHLGDIVLVLGLVVLLAAAGRRRTS